CAADWAGRRIHGWRGHAGARTWLATCYAWPAYSAGGDGCRGGSGCDYGGGGRVGLMDHGPTVVESPVRRPGRTAYGGAAVQGRCCDMCAAARGWWRTLQPCPINEVMLVAYNVVAL